MLNSLQSVPVSSCRRRTGLAAIGAIAAALVVTQASPALADDPDQVTTLTVSSDGSEENATTLVIKLDQPIQSSEVDDALSTLGVDPATLSIVGDTATVVDDSVEVVTPTRPSGPKPKKGQSGDVSVMAGPSGQDLRCGSGYGWSDSNGTFSLQHQCGWSTSPWGFKISLSMRNIIIGYVSELGMRYSVNGINMGRGAPHYVPDDYQFHGTFSHTFDFTRVAYDDYFTFRVNIGGRLGDGAISIAGNFRFVR